MTQKKKDLSDEVKTVSICVVAKPLRKWKARQGR